MRKQQLAVLQVGDQRKGTLRINQLIRTVCQSRKASNFVASSGVVALVGMLLVGSGQPQHSQPLSSARMQPSSADTCAICATSQAISDRLALLRLRPRAQTAVQASTHHISTRGRQRVSIIISSTTPKAQPQPQPVKGRPITPTPAPAHPSPPPPPGGSGVNVFPYGSCTWWADQRYYQLHGVFVPWHTQADAWQWTARAYQYGWRVSSRPVPGAIIDLQPGVQGAYGLGHVAVVEKILSNGYVIASNMAWGANPWQVTYVEFAPGPGVTFIYQ